MTSPKPQDSLNRSPTASGDQDYSHLRELESVTVWAGGGGKGKARRLVIRAGEVYCITPSNPAKLRNRDRVCRVLGFINVSPSCGDVVARVRFLDNNRQGRAELHELVPV